MYTFSHKPNTQAGAAMLISVIFFLVITMTIVMGIATPILQQVKGSIDLFQSKQSFFLAQGSIDDAIYRLRNSKTLTTGDTITINGYNAVLTFDTMPSARLLTSVANVGGRIRKVQTKMLVGVGVSFNYGVQSGNGGFILSNNSGVNGNVYSNGNIVGSSGSFVTNTAVAANSAALTTDQSNGTAGTPTSTINFRNATASQDFAQSFKVSKDSAVNKVRFYMKKTGTPGTPSVKIVTDNGGSPSTTVIDSGTLGNSSGSSAVTTSFGWVDATFTSNAMLYAANTYWIVIDNGGTFNASNYYTVAANSGGYANGIAKSGRYSTVSWNATSPAGLDAYFEIYLGGILSTISGVNVGTGSTGDARAHTVTNSVVAGNLYCQTGSGNNKTCNTTQPDPAPVGFPISDANIDQWRNDATAGGVINGDYTVSGSQVLGPKKINGNLILNGTLTITGTIYVTGNVTGSNGAGAKLDPTYGNSSGVILTDGYVDLSNNMSFSGVNGQSSTYILLITTSTCPNTTPCAPLNSAIYLGNNAGAVILNAQYGKLHLKNGSSASEATANLIELDPTAVITYTTGLANQVFTSGPSGGWEINRWDEVQ